MGNNEKYVRYTDLLKLQMKYRTGLIKDEDLTYEEIILLNRLYDMQMDKMEEENAKIRLKVMRYRRKYMQS